MSVTRPWGNANLKGKRSRMARCGCCVIINHREKHDQELALAEMREISRGGVSVEVSDGDDKPHQNNSERDHDDPPVETGGETQQDTHRGK